MAVRVRTEQHAAPLQRSAQFEQHTWQFLAGHMEQRGVGEYAVEVILRQIEFEKILLPHFAAAIGARHLDEAHGAFQAHRYMADLTKRLQIAPRPAAEIEYRVGRFAFDVL